MAIADWLAPDAPTDKSRLRQDLLELESRVKELADVVSDLADKVASIESATRGLTFENGVPEDSAGSDGWTVVDADSGSVYRKNESVWSKIGEIWWQPASS